MFQCDYCGKITKERYNELNYESCKRIYDASERVLAEKLENEFDTESGFINKCEFVLNEYISFQDKIRQLVLE